MLLYFLTQKLQGPKENLYFLILGSFLFYFVISQFIDIKFLVLIIPYDLFLTSITINRVKKIKKNSHSINQKDKHTSNESLNILNVDKISITETLDHTFKNLGISK